MIKNDFWLWKSEMPGKINPASIDLTLAPSAIAYMREDKQKVEVDGYRLAPGVMLSCSSAEYVKIPENIAGFLTLKSRMGSSGLVLSHVGYFDPGFEGVASFILYAPVVPVTLQAGMRIVQLVLMDCEPPLKSYKETGSFFGQTGPREIS